MKCKHIFFQIDKQLASGEYFLHEKERRFKALQAKKVIFLLAIESQHIHEFHVFITSWVIYYSDTFLLAFKE